MNTQKFEYSQLFAGEVGDIVKVPADVSGYVHVGELFVYNGGRFSRATSVEAGNIYVVCAEHKSTVGGTMTAYASGYFNSDMVRKSMTADENSEGEPLDMYEKLQLIQNHIFVVDTGSRSFEYESEEV